MENKQVPIAEQLSMIHAQQIADNRRKLKSICETIILCGRQGIALRGHRDDRVHLQQDPQENHGNFQALLQFWIDSGDSSTLHQTLEMRFTQVKLCKIS